MKGRQYTGGIYSSKTADMKFCRGKIDIAGILSGKGRNSHFYLLPFLLNLLLPEVSLPFFFKSTVVCYIEKFGTQLTV